MISWIMNLILINTVNHWLIKCKLLLNKIKIINKNLQIFSNKINMIRKLF